MELNDASTATDVSHAAMTSMRNEAAVDDRRSQKVIVSGTCRRKSKTGEERVFVVRFPVTATQFGVERAVEADNVNPKDCHSGGIAAELSKFSVHGNVATCAPAVA